MNDGSTVQQQPATMDYGKAILDLQSSLSTVISRVSNAETNILSLVQNANKIISELLPPMRSKLVELESILAAHAETGVSDAILFIGKQIAAIEQHLATTPQAGGVTFKPVQPPQTDTKPA